MAANRASHLVGLVFLVVGFFFFFKGFFLNRVELSTVSNDYLDVSASFNGKTQEKNAQRFMSGTVIKQLQDHNDNPHALFQNAERISPITTMSTLHAQSTKPQISKQTDAENCSWFCRQYDQIFFLVVDALRFDFLQYNHTLSPDFTAPAISEQHPPYVNRLPTLAKYQQDHAGYSAFYKFRADTPTVTMQRLKAIVTGSLPTFLDVKDNFAATMIQEDNLLAQLTAKKHHSIMVGDDTWMGLVGDLITRAYPFPSFDVHDIDTVDNGCIYRIHHELCGRSIESIKLWLQPLVTKYLSSPNIAQSEKQKFTTILQEIDAITYEKDTQITEYEKYQIAQGVMTREDVKVDYTKSNELPSWFIAHFLGVDHVGHRFGPRHPLMDTKLKQMDGVLTQFLEYIDLYDRQEAHHVNDKTTNSGLFATQVEFVTKYCQKEQTEVLNKYQQDVTKLLKSINTAQDKYESPLTAPRIAVYIMGDHGMTEGGNHGGASSKETDAGFAVFTNAPLSTPSSYLFDKNDKTFGSVEQSQLLLNNINKVIIPKDTNNVEFYQHVMAELKKINPAMELKAQKKNFLSTKRNTLLLEHLPQLNTYVEYPSDVWTNTTTLNERYAMGQIDILPTISLINGVPIPYGNLGVLKKDLVPNHFLQQHKDRLYGTFDEHKWTAEMIAELFTFDLPKDAQQGDQQKIHIQVAELRHELMLLHLRVLNMAQMLRYAKDYSDNVSTFSGQFVQDAYEHSKAIDFKLELIEHMLTELSTFVQSSSGNNVDVYVDLIQSLYLLTLDASQHMHLVMSHIKHGFTREWTQFDMLCMYTSVLVLLALAIYFIVNLVLYVQKYRYNAQLLANYKHNLYCFKDNALSRIYTQIYRLDQMAYYAAIFSLAVTVVLWCIFSTSSLLELHFPIPELFTKIAFFLSNQAPDDEMGGIADAAHHHASHHAAAFVGTPFDNVYVVNIFVFFSIVFSVIMINIVMIRSLMQYALFNQHIAPQSQNQDHIHQPPAIENLWTLLPTGLIVATLLHGLFSNSYISNEAIIMHVCVTLIALWAFFSLAHSYYYYQRQYHLQQHINTSVNNNNNNKSNNKSKQSKKRLAQFLFYCLSAVVIINLMGLEVQLADSNAQSVFGIPLSQQHSFVAMFNHFFSGNATFNIPYHYLNTDVQEHQLHLPLTRLFSNEEDKIQHMCGESSENCAISPSAQSAAKSDPVQVLKTALNMFSPDIAMDGKYVRKDEKVLLNFVLQSKTHTEDSKQIITSLTTHDITPLMSVDQDVDAINGIALLYTPEDYASVAVQDKLSAFLRKLNQHPSIVSNTMEVVIAEVPHHFFDTSVDTRSHYSVFHIVAIFVLFIIALYLLTYGWVEDNTFFSQEENGEDKIIANNLKFISIFAKFITPFTAFGVASYWVPTWIAGGVKPVLTLILNTFGACEGIEKNALLSNAGGDLTGFLSPSTQLQLCSPSYHVVEAYLVSILRSYIPITVYLTAICGVVLLLWTAFKTFQGVEGKLNAPNLIQLLYLVVFPTLCLVSGPRSAACYSLYFMLVFVTKKLLVLMAQVIPEQQQIVFYIQFLVIYSLMVIYLFHCTGHAYSFNDIHIASGFVGVPNYIVGVSEVLVALNTFGGFVFATLGLFFITFTQSDDTKHNYDLSPVFKVLAPAWMMLWWCLRLFCSTTNVFIQRRDLFVWAVYAPKWIFEALFTLITGALTILFTY